MSGMSLRVAYQMDHPAEILSYSTDEGAIQESSQGFVVVVVVCFYL